MNNLNKTEDLIFDIFQVTSPEDFLAMDIEFILNKIENTNDVNINMLKGCIPPELYSEILQSIPAIYSNTDNSPDLNRLKNLLSIEAFERCLELYFETVLENNLIEINIPSIRDNTP